MLIFKAPLNRALIYKEELFVKITGTKKERLSLFFLC